MAAEPRATAALSLSDAEADAQRIALGLAPLARKSQAQVDEEQRAAAEAAHAAARSEEEAALAAALAKRKQQRKLNATIAGSSVSEELKAGGSAAASSAADWVAAMRAKASKTMAAFEEQDVAASAQPTAAAGAGRKRMVRKPKAQAEDDYSTRDLAGLAVKHNAEDFEDGSTTVLTLADERLLTAAGDENTADDVLENAALVERDKRSERDDLKKKKIGYDVAADLDGAAPTLLAQYDHDKKPEKRMVLTGEEKAQRAADVRNRLNAAAARADDGKGVKYELTATPMTVMSEYAAPAPVEFKKKKLRKKVKSTATRKRTTDDDDSGSGSGGNAAMAFLDAAGPQSVAEHQKDHASRSTAVSSDAAARKAQADLKDLSYHKARVKANEATTEMHRPAGADDVDVTKVLANDDEDAETLKAVAAARERAERAAAAGVGKGVKLDPAAALLKAMEASKAAESQSVGQSGSVVFDDSMGIGADSSASSSSSSGGVSSGGSGGSGSVVFTDTTEFTSGLGMTARDRLADAAQAAQLAAQAAAALAASSSGNGKTTSASGKVTVETVKDEDDMDTAEDGPKINRKQQTKAPVVIGAKAKAELAAAAAGGSTTKPAAAAAAAAAASADGDDASGTGAAAVGAGGAESEEDMDFGNDEPIIGKGLARCLEFIKKRGFFRSEDRDEALVGRAKDRARAFDGDDPAPHINIVYSDEKGRTLKPKEAFRVLSHAFHGKKPSAMKTEKKLKKEKEEQRRRNQAAQETAIDSNKKLQNVQHKTGMAHVVLDKKGGALDALDAAEADARPVRPAPGTGKHNKKRKALEKEREKRKRAAEDGTAAAMAAAAAAAAEAPASAAESSAIGDADDGPARKRVKTFNMAFKTAN